MSKKDNSSIKIHLNKEMFTIQKKEIIFLGENTVLIDGKPFFSTKIFELINNTQRKEN
jgi:hypothetical protein